MTQTDEKSVWYREPMVYMLIAIPLTAVIAGFITLALAIKSDDGVVEDDYYVRGKEINRTLHREEASVRYGLKSTLVLDRSQHEMVLQLTGNKSIELPATVQFRLLHATRSGLDQTVLLPRHRDGSYRAPLPELAPGKWNIAVTAQDWRLVGAITVPAESRVAITPTL
jgi:uncharacterized protein